MAAPRSRRVTVRPLSVSLGFALFAIGLVFVAAVVVPFFFGEHNRALWLNAGCLLAPAGLALAVGGAIRAGRGEQRAVADRLPAG